MWKTGVQDLSGSQRPERARGPGSYGVVINMPRATLSPLLEAVARHRQSCSATHRLCGLGRTFTSSEIPSPKINRCT